MEDSSFINILQKHNDKNDEETLKTLMALRKNVNWPENKDNIAKLHEKKCLKYVVAALQSTQRNILNVSLSILGNCCMDKASTGELVSLHNILTPINVLLKRYPKEDSINGRIFRIIGNLCQHFDIDQRKWAAIIIEKKPQIVARIVEYVKKISKEEETDEKVSEATIIMAMQSLSTLLNSKTVITLVKTFGALRAIGALFIKYCIEWETNKKVENILKNIVRLLQEYSRYDCCDSIHEMKNTERGDVLAYLSKVLILTPKRTVHILMNFSRITKLESELPISEIIEKLYEVLETHCFVEGFNNEAIECLQCLCFLVTHDGNEFSESGRKWPSLLITILHHTAEPSNKTLKCCILILETLNSFLFSDRFILEQLQCETINVLIEKLSWLNPTPEAAKLKCRMDRKRKREENLCYEVYNRRYSLSSQSLRRADSPPLCDIEIIMRHSRSPSPCSSTDSDTQTLTWPSPGSSHRSICNASQSDSDDNCPIRSEAGDLPLELPGDDADDLVFVSETDNCEVVEKRVSIGTPDQTSTTLKIRMISEILELLQKFRIQKPPIAQLASEKLLMTLLNICGCFGWSFSPNSIIFDEILSILHTQEYLLPLMQTNFAQEVYELTIQHKIKCSMNCSFQKISKKIFEALSEVGQSGVGESEISHALLHGDSSIKKQMALTVPLVIRNKQNLSTLMLNCGALEILMKLLREDSDSKKRSITALSAMASETLHIKNPHDAVPEQPKILGIKYLEPNGCSEELVTFKLDDGSLLRENREFLIGKSEFFSRLLSGSFKESTQDVVALHNVELKTLRSLLHLVKTIDKMETVDVDLDVDTLLDMIILSDRYLMNDMVVALTNCVKTFRITPKTVPSIYRWSIESGTNFLRFETLAFALVAKIGNLERFILFQNLFELGYSEQLGGDIQNLLIHYLNQ